jgi:hypothetical protein
MIANLSKALLESSRKCPSERAVSDSTVGILFFGVPHRGLRSEELSSIIRGKPNEVIIESLKPESPYLGSLDEGFLHIADSYQWKIWSYWETQLSHTARVREQAFIYEFCHANTSALGS